MNQEIAMIVSKQQVALDTVELVLKNKVISEQAKPGQFIHIFIDGHTLRRPISIANVNQEQQTITIVFKVKGNGTLHLSNYSPGMKLNILGPLGNGFPLEQPENHSSILLIGGGIGIPPLYYLAKILAETDSMLYAVLGFQSEHFMFYEDKFSELANTTIVTDDGSYGRKGMVTDVTDSIPFDFYYSCGPKPMLQAIKNKFVDKQGHLSLEERMGCGIGACYACVIPTNNKQGYKKICSDGPVFSAKEVFL